MGALRQILYDCRPTRGALLTRPARVNPSAQTPGTRSLVRRELDKLIPRRVLNALSQRTVLNHAPNVQLLEKDCAVELNESVTELMGEVVTPEPDPLVNPRVRFKTATETQRIQGFESEF